jgi:AcrR family transcriptional regulator
LTRTTLNDGINLYEHGSVNTVQFNLTFQFVNLKMAGMGINERKTREKQALRDRILEAARRIVIREGFAALSMRKIADAIEYSPATLYLYFASRDEIARALCAEGYAQLLASFEPLAQITDPAERLRALARAYVTFGVAHPQTYRLIFMEDPTYLGAALGGTGEAGKVSGTGANDQANSQADPKVDRRASHEAAHQAEHADKSQAGTQVINPAAGHDTGDASMRLMVGALEELRAAGRLPTSADGAVLAQALWATMHGIVALNLTCPVFPTVPLDTVVDAALDAWFGVREQVTMGAAGAAAATGSAHARRPAAKRKVVDA